MSHSVLEVNATKLNQIEDQAKQKQELNGTGTLKSKMNGTAQKEQIQIDHVEAIPPKAITPTRSDKANYYGFFGSMISNRSSYSPIVRKIEKNAS